ncbi:DNA-3-methyladenine glycosylase family protein [Aquibacillus salsiterrae]|uniref:DNA-3-methyladenine glycosylase II n=1 Tax=Aquibacillus salsiterrae TaxID=2950439 RepID=A0A9X3WGV1_9BACI|nr:DNA-3-methyladenine glycosylase [Aquibacillus salsiterrae]MDC3418176.1 DNA-3-methyladenine glycosylase [Aquibacillus salsiterrae]
MWKEVVQTSFSYDFDYVLKRLAMDPLNKLDLANKKIHVPLTMDGKKTVAEVQAVGSTRQPVFEIIGADEEDKQLTLERVSDLFQWAKDLDIIGKHLSGTNLDSLVEHYPGTPIVKDFDLFWSLVKTIIHQQLNMKFAHTLSARFVQTYGEQHHGVWFYPSPDVVANISYSELRELQFSQRKAEYVIDTSRLIASGQLDLGELSQDSDEEVLHKLTRIRGIGKWTAEGWLLFGNGRNNFLPKTDIGIQNALKRYFQLEKKPSLEEITDWSKDWHPYRSYATMTLWRSIE